MSWECGPGPGDGKQGPGWFPKLAEAIIIILIVAALMGYCGTEGG